MSTEVNELKQQACDRIDAVAQELVEVSHDIHAHPEQNFAETYAAELLTRTANELGLPTERNMYGCETGFSGEVGTGSTVCVMSEYDALPDIGHGCGHNIIAAAGLGAAIGLAVVAPRAGGRLRYLGTPAEEGGGGKLVMARNGALNGVDIAMMVHSADADLTTIDAIALQQLVVEYSGEAAHAAAAPERGRNALDAAVLGVHGSGCVASTHSSFGTHPRNFHQSRGEAKHCSARCRDGVVRTLRHSHNAVCLEATCSRRIAIGCVSMRMWFLT